LSLEGTDDSPVIRFIQGSTGLGVSDDSGLVVPSKNTQLIEIS